MIHACFECEPPFIKYLITLITRKSSFKVDYNMFQIKFCIFRNFVANRTSQKWRRFIFIYSHFQFHYVFNYLQYNFNIVISLIINVNVFSWSWSWLCWKLSSWRIFDRWWGWRFFKFFEAHTKTNQYAFDQMWFEINCCSNVFYVIFNENACTTWDNLRSV